MENSRRYVRHSGDTRYNCLHERQVFCAFEVKQPGGRLTRLQEVTLEKIRAAGGVAVKVTSVEEVKAAILEEGG